MREASRLRKERRTVSRVRCTGMTMGAISQSDTEPRCDSRDHVDLIGPLGHDVSINQLAFSSTADWLALLAAGR